MKIRARHKIRHKTHYTLLYALLIFNKITSKQSYHLKPTRVFWRTLLLSKTSF